ncbi:unnamed protein product [Mesocestoides corti]|uniref:Uncharacterized protein n=1 Tax=Mesocestoides corti TaxID=53468 RepID=A0A0R3UND7_MESCO|nr:unnamed protein product [Mesocestoides corti]
MQSRDRMAKVSCNFNRSDHSYGPQWVFANSRMSLASMSEAILFPVTSQHSEGSTQASQGHGEAGKEGCEISKFGDIDTKVSGNLPAQRNSALKPDNATILTPTSQKRTPLLTSPPGLIRRFADCDLTGDCQIREPRYPELELPIGSLIPGDNNEREDDSVDVTDSERRSKWRGRLFRSIKKSLSRRSEKESSRSPSFRPVRDIFHLLGRNHLWRKQSFLEDNSMGN